MHKTNQWGTEADKNSDQWLTRIKIEFGGSCLIIGKSKEGSKDENSESVDREVNQTRVRSVYSDHWWFNESRGRRYTWVIKEWF